MVRSEQMASIAETIDRLTSYLALLGELMEEKLDEAAELKLKLRVLSLNIAALKRAVRCLEEQLQCACNRHILTLHNFVHESGSTSARL